MYPHEKCICSLHKENNVLSNNSRPTRDVRFRAGLTVLPHWDVGRSCLTLSVINATCLGVTRRHKVCLSVQEVTPYDTITVITRCSIK